MDQNFGRMNNTFADVCWHSPEHNHGQKNPCPKKRNEISQGPKAAFTEVAAPA